MLHPMCLPRNDVYRMEPVDTLQCFKSFDIVVDLLHASLLDALENLPIHTHTHTLFHFS